MATQEHSALGIVQVNVGVAGVSVDLADFDERLTDTRDGAFDDHAAALVITSLAGERETSCRV